MASVDDKPFHITKMISAANDWIRTTILKLMKENDYKYLNNTEW